MRSQTLTVRGYKLRNASMRRYLVVAVSHRDGNETGVATVKRSDNLSTARTWQKRYGVWSSSFAVIIDTVTGEEVRG